MVLRRISLVLDASAVLLASCTAAPAPTTPDAAAPDSTTATTGDVLADAGVAGLSATEAIEHLDASTDARPLPFRASVTGTELVLQAADAEPVTMAVPEDRFYLSVAPMPRGSQKPTKPLVYVVASVSTRTVPSSPVIVTCTCSPTSSP